MGSGGGTVKTENTPWNAEQLTQMYGMANNLFQTPQQYTPWGQVAGQSAMTLEGQQAGLGLIRGAGQGATGGYLENLMSGQYLDQSTNPALRGLADRGAADITRQYKTALYPGASMAGMGRAGSGAEMNMQGQAMRGLGDALSRNYSDIYGQNYQMERQNMQQGVGLQSQYGQNMRANIGMGAMLGGQADQYQQRLLGDQTNRFNYGQQEPTNRFNQYRSAIQGGGMIPGTSSQGIPGQPFGAAQGIGLGISALGLFMGCSKKLKTKLSEVDYPEALSMLQCLEIFLWKYKPEVAAENGDRAVHMGPMAEDFQQIFKLGDGKTLAFIDIIGVTMAALRGAAEKIKELEQRVANVEIGLRFEPVEVAHG